MNAHLLELTDLEEVIRGRGLSVSRQVIMLNDRHRSVNMQLAR